MKTQDNKALQQLSQEELTLKLETLKKEVTKLKLELAVNRVTDLKTVSKINDDIARIKTVLKSKQLN